MRIEIQDSFIEKLERQISFIAADKPKAARKFKANLLKSIQQLSIHPFKNKKSIYFNREDIRDLTFKGYTIVYKVNQAENLISVFALIKQEQGLKS
jgi:plasmid stabilization system protein ParE